MTEQLSNLMDDKITSESLDQILDARPSQRLMSKWQGYHLISAVLKGEVKAHDIKFDVADKVILRLETETNIQDLFDPQARPAPDKHKHSTGLRIPHWGGWAIAASLVGGVYLFNWGLNSTSIDRLVAQNPSPSASVNINWQAPLDVEARLNSLLVEHSEFKIGRAHV